MRSHIKTINQEPQEQETIDQEAQEQCKAKLQVISRESDLEMYLSAPDGQLSVLVDCNGRQHILTQVESYYELLKQAKQASIWRSIVMTTYILKYTLENGFQVDVVAEASSEASAKAAAGQILGALQNASSFEIHPAIKMLNQQTPVESERWNIGKDRRTNGGKQFIVYYITNNTPASKIEYGKGIKSAYLNFKDAQNRFNKNMGGYRINIFNAVVIIDTTQQVSMVKQKQFNENQQKYEMDASKALNALSQQARQLRQMGSNLNILAVKQNSLYWIYRANGGFNTKVVFSNPNQIDRLQYVIKGFKKRQIDADIVLVSRDFIDTMEMKGVDGYKLYESIRGNLAVGVIAGTGIGQELKDPNIVDGMFEIKVGDVWSKQRSVQTWKNIIGSGSMSQSSLCSVNKLTKTNTIRTARTARTARTGKTSGFRSVISLFKKMMRI